MEKRLCYFRRDDNAPVLRNDLGFVPESEAIEEPKQLIAKKALKFLDKAKKQDSVDIAGETVIDPKQAHEKFVEALKLVRQYFGDHLDIDLNDITFQKLAGEQVGESTDTQTLVDPKIFRHPAYIIASVLAHELMHEHNEIQNEGMVQACVEAVFGKNKIEHKYGELVENFEIFAAQFDKDGDKNRGCAKIIKLYKAKKFERIYTRYLKTYVKKLKTPEEKIEARKFFQTVFPELEFEGREPGFYTMKELAKRQDTL